MATQRQQATAAAQQRRTGVARQVSSSSPGTWKRASGRCVAGGAGAGDAHQRHPPYRSDAHGAEAEVQMDGQSCRGVRPVSIGPRAPWNMARLARLTNCVAKNGQAQARPKECCGGREGDDSPGGRVRGNDEREERAGGWAVESSRRSAVFIQPNLCDLRSPEVPSQIVPVVAHPAAGHWRSCRNPSVFLQFLQVPSSWQGGEPGARDWDGIWFCGEARLRGIRGSCDPLH